MNDIEGGIQELVENEVTGYKIKQNNPAEYADRIAQLADKEALKAAIKRHAIEKSNALFDPYENTRLIEEQICTLYDGVRHNKTPKAIYGSRLDKSWIPNFITKTVRTLR